MTLGKIGFQTIREKHKSWEGTYNITITAQKGNSILTQAQRIYEAKKILKRSLVDQSISEIAMLNVWEAQFDRLIQERIN